MQSPADGPYVSAMEKGGRFSAGSKQRKDRKSGECMETADLIFHEITIQDKGWMDEKFAQDGRNACEYTFANNYIWRKGYRVEVAEYLGCLVIRFWEQGEYHYSYPVGDGDKKAVIDALLRYCHDSKQKLTMSPLSEEDRTQLLLWFPGKFLIEGDRDDYDYIYSREKLALLPGKKLHGKRNHIARFKDGDDWSYEPLTEENLEDCRTMTYQWMRMRSEKWNEEMEEEVIVLHEAFDHRKELGLIGGVLRKAGEIVAFCMGEPLNKDVFVVHFEKAYPDLQGAYPMINQQFVLHECEAYQFVNREEDTGDMGLRKAKLSYYPEILLKKYVAAESRVVFADRMADGEQIIRLWEACFGDTREEVLFYLDHRMTEDNMLVIHEDGKVVSMASFLPVQYRMGEEYLSAHYVYAVGTLPEYRGRGYAAEVLRFARERYDGPLILAPAEESLCMYYEQMGFMRAFPEEQYEIVIEDASRDGADLAATELRKKEPQEVLQPVTAEEYAAIRDEKKVCEGYVRWDAEAVRYAMELTERCGGGTCAVLAENGEKDILMYEKNGDTLVILETTLSGERLKEMCPIFLRETGTHRTVYDQMAGMLWFPDLVRGGADYSRGYLNLTLG